MRTMSALAWTVASNHWSRTALSGLMYSKSVKPVLKPRAASAVGAIAAMAQMAVKPNARSAPKCPRLGSQVTAAMVPGARGVRAGGPVRDSAPKAGKDDRNLERKALRRVVGGVGPADESRVGVVVEALGDRGEPEPIAGRSRS